MLKLIFSIALLFILSCNTFSVQNELKTGAAQPEIYLKYLKGMKVGLVVNHTSLIGETHLVDFLLDQNISIKKIFAPEHGFRGDASAGEQIKDGVDEKTGLSVISLYGKTRKPSPDHLNNLDIVVFDIQDVGCRFYTFISTLHLVLEACAENNIPLLVLDRPNPNGDYIAGPVLDKDFQSFVGMDPIPIVHGCTVGELAKMINGEIWHKANSSCELTIIPVKNYSHKTRYSLPVRPSPNLPNDLSVRLYPSLCFFEATSVSVGRGTDFPFQALGGLNSNLGSFSFVPESIPGISVNPLNKGKTCYGIDLRQLDEVPEFTLKYFLDFYKQYKNEKEFLVRERWLSLLAGNNNLIEQIREGNSEEKIFESWQPELKEYKEVRKKYLMYPDFE